jgi:hypothetical protein
MLLLYTLSLLVQWLTKLIGVLSLRGRLELRWSKRLPIVLVGVSEAVARNERLADEVAAHALNMHPQDMFPFFPAPNSTLVDFEICK